jgi:hypothetical protein
VDFDGDGLAVGLATLGQPLAKGGCKSFRIDLEAGLHLAFRNGQGVVKFRRTGEIAHAEGVQPVERTGLALFADNHIHLQLLGVHGGSIAPVAPATC